MTWHQAKQEHSSLCESRIGLGWQTFVLSLPAAPRGLYVLTQMFGLWMELTYQLLSRAMCAYAGPVNNCSSHLTPDVFCTISRYRAGKTAITDSSNTLQGLPWCWGLLLLPLLSRAKHTPTRWRVRASECSSTFRACSNLVHDLPSQAAAKSFLSLTPMTPRTYLGPSSVLWRRGIFSHLSLVLSNKQSFFHLMP